MSFPNRVWERGRFPDRVWERGRGLCLGTHGTRLHYFVADNLDGLKPSSLGEVSFAATKLLPRRYRISKIMSFPNRVWERGRWPCLGTHGTTSLLSSALMLTA